MVHPDLKLVRSALDGDVEALQALDLHFIQPVARLLCVRLGLPQSPDDLAQLLSETLWAPGDDGQRRLSRYSGEGSFLGWLRVVGARLAWKLGAAHRPLPLADEDELVRLGTRVDPDLLLLKQRHGAQVSLAVKAALQALPVRQRNLLRFHYIDGLGGDAMGNIYNVDRRTIHRWLADARATVERTTRAHLVTQLGLAADELDSVVRGLKTAVGDALVSGLREPP